ncbi:hypothetical protein V1J52_08245 [Streptomyces sp. TRM 70351]|uniref:hypothetical protein n=1 Tax=Streptomyces sp. TRM 70351 TaxID=3116552 RepID=UPI002E7BDC0A|nr:hypothetical protein [Streptomyces sp. TRM 70351]MEE1928183.1 hypothetical protein [Streptomyces sp. TRM 70351]
MLRRRLTALLALAVALGTAATTAPARAVPAGLVPAQAAPAGVAPAQAVPAHGQDPRLRTRTVRYGPYTIPASDPNAPGGHHGGTGNTLKLGVEAPCGHCYIKGIKPDLVYPDGSNANVDTGPMLHHFVMYNQFRRDPVCGTDPTNPSFWLGERFAASGNERTFIDAPSGYGYYNAPLHRWNLIAELMTHAHEEQEVYIEVEYTYLPAHQAERAGWEKVRPVWLSVAGCATLDEVPVPSGRSATSWEWDVDVPGTVVGMGGHLHNGGVSLVAEKTGTGETLCDSVARYGETPEYVNLHGGKELSSMGRCIDPEGVGTVGKGDTVRLTAHYDTRQPIADAMGIMVTYIAGA